MRRFQFALIFILTILTPASWAWWGGGHDILTQASIKALSDELPAFFRSEEAIEMISHCAYDPDVSKNRDYLHARTAEYGEHYFDIELIKDNPVPADRDAFLKLCAEMKLKPSKVGFLPYSVAEWTERLAIAFAEYRKWPDNPIIQYKCYVYAGFLAHYAQDLCQPLHLTVHYDGILQEDGSKLHEGIHEKVDASIEVLKLDPTELAKNQQVKVVGELMPAIVKQMKSEHGFVDRVYELVKDYQDLQKPSKALQEFTNERSRESVHWTASLFLTAWELSAKVKLPGWLER